MPPYVQMFVKFSRHWDDAVICEGQPTRQFLVERLKHNPERTVYLPNGIDLKAFEFSAVGRDKIRREWGIQEGEILIGTAGRLTPQKGLPFLLEAVNCLKGGPQRFRVVVLGEGAQRLELEKSIAELRVAVELKGVRPDMPDVLSGLDIYVQSSIYEGMPVILLEAMAVGLPIVATAVDGTLDVGRDGENMLLVRPADVDSLALGLATLLEKPDLRKKLSNEARKTAKNYSIERMVRAFEKEYDEIVQG